MSEVLTGTYSDNTGDRGWANAHIDEMAEKYPGKIVGISEGEVVVVADDKADWEAKVFAYHASFVDEGNARRSVTPVPRRQITAP